MFDLIKQLMKEYLLSQKFFLLVPEYLMYYM